MVNFRGEHYFPPECFQLKVYAIQRRSCRHSNEGSIVCLYTPPVNY